MANLETRELLTIGHLASRLGVAKATIVAAARRLGIAPSLIVNGIQHFDAAEADRIRRCVAEGLREALPGPAEGPDGESDDGENLAEKHGADTRAGTISLDFYLPRLDDGTLAGLRELAADCVSESSKRLGKWLDEVLVTEQARRQSPDGGADVDLPAFPVLGWTDREVGDALGAAVVLLDAVDGGNADATEFVKTTLTATVALAVSKLYERKQP